MKKLLFLSLAIGGAAFAAPFVAPDSWSTSKPSEVRTGGVFRLTTLQDFKTLNPFVTAESPNLPAILNGVALLGIDPVTGKIFPYMAEKYTQSADKRTFTFQLRQGMKWSDGKPITVDDFVTSYTIHSDEKVGSNSYDSFFINGQPIKVAKVNDKTLTITFPKPDVTSLEFIAGFEPQPTHVFMPVYKSKGADGIKAMWNISADPKEIVTAGTFVLDRYVKGERAVLKKNPYYGEWNKDSAGKPLPYLDGAQITIVPDANAELTQFLAGNIDRYSPITRDQLAQVKGAIDSKKINGTLVPNASAKAGSDFMFFNLDEGNSFKGKLFSNPKFRQAMSMLVNRDAMVDLTLGGLGQPMFSGVYPVFKDWIPTSGLDKYKFNPQGAAKLLAELGFTKKGSDGVLVDKAGNKLEFTLLTNAGNARREGYAKIIQDEAKKVGVKINTSFIAFNQLTSLSDAKPDFSRRGFDAIIMGLGGGNRIYPVSGPNVVVCNLPKGSTGNLHMYNQSGKCRFPFETQLVNLYWKGRAQFDEAQRKATAAQIQRVEMENQPFIQLAAQTAHFAWTDRVKGEFPKAAMNSINAGSFGPRSIDLTWIKN